MNEMCGMIADAIISGANRIPGAIRMADRRGGAACERGPLPRRVPARSRVPAKNVHGQKSGNRPSDRSSTDQQGSDGGPLATLLAAVHGRMWRHDVRPPSDSGNQE
jgi:hypothetical protein